MAIVLLASPPCQEYSKANTKPGPRDLAGADALGKIVYDCHEHLQAMCTVMENPAYPGHLPSRPVAGFLPKTCELNYCAHGGIFFLRKRSSGVGLPGLLLQNLICRSTGSSLFCVEIRGAVQLCCMMPSSSSGYTFSGRAPHWRSVRPSRPKCHVGWVVPLVPI